MIESIFKILESALGIWQNENSTKYLKRLYKLQKEYDDENDKDIPNRNILDRTERDILRLSNLVATQIKGSPPSSV